MTADPDGSEETRDEDLEDSKMPLLDHLIELRKRLIICAVVLLVLFFICFAFAQDIFNFLAAPLADVLKDDDSKRFIFTNLLEAFFTQVKVAFFGAAFFTLPLILAQVWLFVAPGLYKNERAVFMPFLIATPALFTLGAAICYYFILPLAFTFLAGFETAGGDGVLPQELEARVGEYIDLIMKLLLAFGICFELPVVTTLMARTGMLTAQGMVDKRKFAIVGVFAVAAVFTPPDPISMLTLAIPVCLLYELSILLVRMTERKRQERQEQLEEEEQPS